MKKTNQSNPYVFSGDYEWKTTEFPFLYLTAELPPPPLFKDEYQENIIPKVSEVIGRFEIWKIFYFLTVKTCAVSFMTHFDQLVTILPNNKIGTTG